VARRAASGCDVEELGLGFVRLAGDLTLDIIESWAIMLDGVSSDWEEHELTFSVEPSFQNERMPMGVEPQQVAGR
jgi:hypothetical protein